MNPEQIGAVAQIIEKYGFGAVSFAVLLFVGYTVSTFMKTWLEKVYEKLTQMFELLQVITGNHLTHIEKNTEESNKKLDVQNQILVIHTQKLDQIKDKVTEQTAQTVENAEKVATAVTEAVSNPPPV